MFIYLFYISHLESPHVLTANIHEYKSLGHTFSYSVFYPTYYDKEWQKTRIRNLCLLWENKRLIYLYENLAHMHCHVIFFFLYIFLFFFFFFSFSQAASSSDEISLIYSCWVTFIGLYIANYVAERSSEWVPMYHAWF